jgi:hypothetical protein
MGFALGLHGLKAGFAWFQTQDKPAKNRVYFLTTPKSGGKTLPSKTRTQNLCAHLQTRQKRGREHRGNPDGLSASFVVPENGTAAWIATSLRSSLLTRLVRTHRFPSAFNCTLVRRGLCAM